MFRNSKLHLAQRIVASTIFLTSLVTTSVVSAQEGSPPPVIVSKVVQKEWSDVIEALGTLRANETVVLTASVTDTITKIHFEDGQRVEKGYVLAEMTGEEESAMVREMTARKLEAKKQFERLKNLPGTGAVSESLYDQRKREYEAATAQLEAMTSRLQDRLIVAPFSGVLGLRNISMGALVEPGDEIATLTDDAIMKLDFSVPSVFLSSLKSGLTIVAYSDAYPGENFQGEVTGIDSTIDPSTRSLVVRARLANERQLLKPGLLMNVALQYNNRQTLVVPEEAIIPSASSTFVFTVEPGKTLIARKREVKIGGRKAGQVEIVSGLTQGTQVITHGTMIARDGEPVTIRATQKEGESVGALIEMREDAAA